MAKRTYPFEESHVTQHKIFIGQKQVNEGIMKNINMEKVYDSTMKKLFSGMKSICKLNSDGENNNNNYNNIHVLKENLQISQVEPKQLQINFQGKLLDPKTSSITVKLNRGPEVQCKNFCKDCKSDFGNKNIINLFSCSYCEVVLCDKCFRICNKCLNGYCSPCSFMEYKENMEMSICLSCV